jgi:membrane protein implicated in regulation of membrane protease activity
MPRREWLAVWFPPLTGGGLLAVGALAAVSTAHGWLAFSAALVAGAVTPAVYTLVLARQGRLFLRDPDAIERSRATSLASASHLAGCWEP